MSKFAMLKPPVSQPILKRAFLEYPSALFSTHRLEDKGMIQRVNIQPNKYHPRDQRTERIVYVEPHNAKIASNIPLFTYLIKSHNPEKEKWFPIQAVFRDDDQLTNKYAYVLMNGNVEMAWSKGTKKWKELWPDNWIVMPKKEQEKRTEEYKALHRQELDEAEDAEPGKQAHWGLEEAEAFPKPEESDKQSSVTHSVRDSSNLKGHVSKTQSTRMNSLAIADKGTVEVKPQIEQPKKASRKQAAKRKMKKKKAAKKAAAKSGEEDT
ncbi:hypothetical protein EJ05DRAFT_480499 [Pseudovirgaria hyperparasitica]|uniref:Uncharacterized protein n=1 Tax=Pseudovirgaria hyperparasitica TaxID=470096 RepID=A0A6A6VUV4_9PEZI|nr:uncharacterized protein EJ05DRAFT_480499 [Pseudovirgaria hyperparasitica]KAF2753504.1 hypothetical protein EJ05DRAFT_480499 [Pseudovirgaria hyperparasitica]